MSGLTCYISSDNDVTVEGLTVASSGAYANAATVEASILLASSAALVSGSTTTLSYVTGSNGKYFGSIPSSVSMAEGTEYILKITAAQSGKDIEVRIRFKAGYYEGCQG